MGTPKTPIEQEAAEALLGWLEAFPNKTLEGRLSALLRQRRDLDVEIRFLQAQIMRHRAYLEDLHPEGTGKDEQRQAAQDADSRPQFPPKRMAALRLLSETPGRALRLADIRTTLIKRGWLEDSDKAKHALQVTLLSMARRGEIEKPRTGFYRLPVNDGLPAVPESGEELTGQAGRPVKAT